MKRILLTMILAASLATAANAGNLSPGLEALLTGKADHEFVTVLIVMENQPDIRALDKSLHGIKAPMSRRHAEVVGTLQAAANDSQRDLLAALATEKAAGDVVGYTSHWIVNSIVMRATVAKVRELALREDVAAIEPDLEFELIEPVMVKDAVVHPHKDAAGFVTPGLRAVNADRVWHELGIDGSGSLVANMDSGVDGSHPALGPRWRGNYAPAAECWQNITGAGNPVFPFDDHGHGTHVMGTITGATFADTVGVAPGAHWIASNAIRSTSATLDNNIIAAFEWFTDPDGNPATTDDVPDVVQNSWGVSPSFGPYLECDSRWWDVIDNCEAAGVVVVWAAGNEGPVPSSLRSPPNRASTPTSCFSVGSTITTEPYTISGFSARGPSQCGGPYAIKPEVSAPGQDILSTFPGGYGYMSGTSMAGPHVAGIVALMRAANPDVDVVTIKEILMETALDLGEVGEDNTYGHGLVDAYQAVLTVLTDVGSVAGIISDSDTGLPLEGALIADMNSSTQLVTGPDGAYAFTKRAGPTTFLVTKYGWQDTIVEVDIPTSGHLDHDIIVSPADWGRISGFVRGPGDVPLVGATVTALGVPLEPAVSDATGAFEIALPTGNNVAYDLLAEAPGLAYDLRQIGLQADVTQDFALTVINSDGFEGGLFNAYDWQHGGDLPWTIESDEAYEGFQSARAGNIDDSQTSELSLEYYVNGDGEFSFWYMTESETVYDKLQFYIDGELEGNWHGETPWTLFSRGLTTGLHSFRWVYSKDSSASVMRDAVWIDLVTFPGTGVQPFPTIAPTGETVEAQIDAGTVVPVPLTVANTGGFQLDYTTTLVDLRTGETPTWVVTEPASGTIAPGNANEINLVCDGSAVPAGPSEALLTIHSNDPAHPDTTVAVNLTVGAVSYAGEAVPQLVTFQGAVPNPFNPATDIMFNLGRDVDMTLRVYDIAGRLVRTLLDGNMSAGGHRVRWDGCDDTGQAVASGVYFARLQAADRIETGRMALVR